MSAVKPAAAANAVETESTESLEYEAEYTLEAPVKCPLCKTTVKTLNVLRMLRSRVNFTSNLPRRGWVAACPSCHGIVTVGVASLLTS